MNFCGNHALDPDPRIPLAKCWLYNNCKGCTNTAATAASRGGQAVDWPLAEIVRRGYGVATFCSNDVDSDRAEVSDGVYAWLAEGDATGNNPTNRGSIAAWAWGFHRCMDYLMADPAVDTNPIEPVSLSPEATEARSAGGVVAVMTRGGSR